LQRQDLGHDDADKPTFVSVLVSPNIYARLCINRRRDHMSEDFMTDAPKVTSTDSKAPPAVDTPKPATIGPAVEVALAAAPVVDKK